MPFEFHLRPSQRTALALAIASLFAPSVFAQTAASPAAATSTVVVTGNPLGREDLAAPVSTLSGDRLLLQRGSTLGETLEGLPGLASTYFGPNANRPTIRGQDGDRIRLLSNAGASLDASSLSFDHAVPIDPLVVERLEVVRGPAALLYGGSAVGGVVNAIDNRIPRQPVQGFSGMAEARFGGAARERGLSALLEGGGGGWAWHADAFKRRTDDLRVPSYLRPSEDGEPQRQRRVLNSASDAEGGAVGASHVWASGHAGASVDTYRNTYGTPAEEHVLIRMRRDKLALDGEWRDLQGPVRTLRAQAGFTDYRHDELHDGEVETEFKNRGSDLRVEAVHRPWSLGGGALLEGVWGLQAESSRFRASGEEAFVPSTRTRQLAVFALEQWTLSPQWQLSAGLRGERVTVSSAGDAPDSEEPRFGDAMSRRFSPRSGSLGAVWKPADGWQLYGTLAHTERAPASYELYANGVHAATSVFERGNPNQAKEQGRHGELGAQWKREGAHLKLGVFSSRFTNYIVLRPTGEPDVIDDHGHEVPVMAFEGVRARLRGVELDGGFDLARGLELHGQLSLVRGDDLTHREPLPRIAPLRATLGLRYDQGPWLVSGQVEHAARQTRVPAEDTATPASTRFNASLGYRHALGGAEALWFAKLQNIGNRLAYNASTIATVRELSPLPGRSVQLGVRVRF